MHVVDIELAIALLKAIDELLKSLLKYVVDVKMQQTWLKVVEVVQNAFVLMVGADELV